MVNQRRRPYTLPCSAANTPNWQVNDDATRISVKVTAYGMFSSVGAGGQPWVARARAVKYMAKSPAKNISSLASQMIVPTLTMLGRVRECTREVSKALLATGAVVTGLIMASGRGRHDRGWDGRGGKVISSISTPTTCRGFPAAWH